MSSARIIPSLAIAVAALAGVSCSSLRCAFSPPYGDPLVEVAHISPGDGPTITLLNVYSHGLLELEPVGLRRRCAWSQKEKIAKLKKQIESKTVAEALSSGAAPVEAVHEEMVSVRADGGRAVAEVSRVPLELAQLLSIVDELFVEAFGESYMRFARLPARPAGAD